jgi:predicted flavoprotein YhiN
MKKRTIIGGGPAASMLATQTNTKKRSSTPFVKKQGKKIRMRW